MPSHWNSERLFARLGPWAGLGRSNGRHARLARSAWPVSTCSRGRTPSTASCPTLGCAGERRLRWKVWRPRRSPWPWPPGHRPPARGWRGRRAVLGLAAAAELGVALDRLVLVAPPSRGSGPRSRPPWSTRSTWCWPALRGTARRRGPPPPGPGPRPGRRPVHRAVHRRTEPTSRWRPPRSIGRAWSQGRPPPGPAGGGAGHGPAGRGAPSPGRALAARRRGRGRADEPDADVVPLHRVLSRWPASCTEAGVVWCPDWPVMAAGVAPGGRPRCSSQPGGGRLARSPGRRGRRRPAPPRGAGRLPRSGRPRPRPRPRRPGLRTRPPGPRGRHAMGRDRRRGLPVRDPRPFPLPRWRRGAGRPGGRGGREALGQVGVAGAAGVGVADGRFTAEVAARGRPSGAAEVGRWSPGESAAFLAPSRCATRHLERRSTRASRPARPPRPAHVGALAALPARDMVDRFGPVGRLAHRLASGGDERPPDTRRPPPELAVQAELEPPVPRAWGRWPSWPSKLADDLHARLATRPGLHPGGRPGRDRARRAPSGSGATSAGSPRRHRRPGALAARRVGRRARPADGRHQPAAPGARRGGARPRPPARASGAARRGRRAGGAGRRPGERPGGAGGRHRARVAGRPGAGRAAGAGAGGHADSTTASGRPSPRRAAPWPGRLPAPSPATVLAAPVPSTWSTRPARRRRQRPGPGQRAAGRARCSRAGLGRRRLGRSLAGRRALVGSAGTAAGPASSWSRPTAGPMLVAWRAAAGGSRPPTTDGRLKPDGLTAT